MKNLLHFFLFTFCFLTISTAAQTTVMPETKNIFWSEDISCGKKNFTPTPQDSLICTATPGPGARTREIQHNYLTVSARTYITANYYTAEVRLYNRSGQPRKIALKEWTITYYENEEAFLAGKPAIATRKYEKTPDLGRGSTDSAYISDMGARVVQNPTTGMGEIRMNNPNRASGPGNTSSRYITETNILKNNLIEPYGTSAGIVYFPHKDDPELRLVTIKIDDVSYTFPVKKSKGAITPKQPPPKKIAWAEIVNCGERNLSVAADDVFNCSSLIKNGQVYLRFRHKGLTLAARFSTEGNYVVADVELENATDKQVLFDTREWLILNYERADNRAVAPLTTERPVQPQVGLFAGQRLPVRAKALVSSKEKVAGRIYFNLHPTAQDRVINIEIDGTHYLFPFRRN